MMEKKALYEKYGVKEYIIVNPLENYAERFVLMKTEILAKVIYSATQRLYLSFP
jgi:Uma2 family endonuclease